MTNAPCAAPIDHDLGRLTASMVVKGPSRWPHGDKELEQNSLAMTRRFDNSHL